MPQFAVDDDLVELVWRLANPKPFENLSFSGALRRVLKSQVAAEVGKARIDESSLQAGTHGSWQKKLQSPDPAAWAASVPELKGLKNMSSWQAICSALRIEVAGDSARRKLRNWVKANKPHWPPVPSIESDASSL